MAEAKQTPVVLGSAAATRRQWLHLWSATTVLSVLNCLLFYLISGPAGAILPGCVAVVMGAGLQALVFADRAFAGVESRWALSARRESAVLFGVRFRPNIRFLPLYARLGGTGVLVRGVSAVLLSGLLTFVLVRDFKVGFAAMLLAGTLACAILPEFFWGALLLGAGMIVGAAQQQFGTAAWPTLFVLAAAGSEIIYFIWLQANMQEQVRFANEIPPRHVALRHRAWLSSAVVLVLLMVIVFAFCKPRPRPPRLETMAGAERVQQSAKFVAPEQTDTRPATGRGGRGDLQAGRGPEGGPGHGQGGGVSERPTGRGPIPSPGHDGDLATLVCRLLPFLCQPASRSQGGGLGELLEHRSSIAPSPLGGEGWDGGAEAGTDTASHTWPGGGAYPPPARGREAARTSSPSNYLTDVLAGRGQDESLGRGSDPGARPGEGGHGAALGRGAGQDEAPGRSGGAGGGQGGGLGRGSGAGGDESGGLGRGSGTGEGLRGGASRGERLAGPGGGDTGGNVRIPERGGGGPALADQPSDATDQARPSNVQLPELKLEYKKIGLAIAVLFVLGLVVYLWLRRKRKAGTTDEEDDQENVKLSPEQVRSAINRFRQHCQELLDTPIGDDRSAREKVIELYNFLLAHFAECGVGKPPYFTPDEYAYRESTERPAIRDELSHVTMTFNQALYGLMAPPPDEFKMYIRHIARLGGFVKLY